MSAPEQSRELTLCDPGHNGDLALKQALLSASWIISPIYSASCFNVYCLALTQRVLAVCVSRYQVYQVSFIIPQNKEHLFSIEAWSGLGLVWAWSGPGLGQLWAWSGTSLALVWDSFGPGLGPVWASFGSTSGLTYLLQTDPGC